MSILCLAIHALFAGKGGVVVDEVDDRVTTAGNGRYARSRCTNLNQDLAIRAGGLWNSVPESRWIVAHR